MRRERALRHMHISRHRPYVEPFMPPPYGMPMRDFTDATGVTWKVWSTVPLVAPSFGANVEGWLTFESAESRRRLTPIPPGWETASDAQLAAFCASAREVTNPAGAALP